MSSVCKNCGHDESACTFDEVVRRARDLITTRGVASQALLTRELKISYSFAMRALEQLEEEGLIGPADGAQPRQVFVD
jgi:S-DNA-T family DNA segregation ATPase FtsK/SpoIIIE